MQRHCPENVFVLYDKSISRIDIVQNIAKELSVHPVKLYFLCGSWYVSEKIQPCYVCRWSVEVFFRQCKDKRALDSYQICSAQGICRYWFIMSQAHYICVVGTGEFCSFENGYYQVCNIISYDKYQYLFQ